MHTFLFTDIESSTRLWEEQPEAMSRALARHDDLLRKGLEANGGRVLKTTGDGMIAVFDAPSMAVSTAVAAQRAIEDTDWGPTGTLRVRMGIHSGDSDHRDQDFFGPTMNRTARIMAAAHGGEILISATVVDLAASSLPIGVSLQDLGTHRLKDLTDPVHLYQLTHPDIRSDFPPPITLDARPHNLPLQTTEFLGRDEELAAIETMLNSPGARLVTLTGPGGAGKTRIALQVAAEQVDRFGDGVFFVDLSAERDPGAAFEAILRALDLPLSGTGDALQLLKGRLRDREMLLILDNLEQITSIGPGLGELLQAVPKLRVVATSRETLRIRAERVFPIPPMSLPHPADPPTVIAQAEAVRLFAERARMVRPEFAVTLDNALILAEICLRLDGLPLAIELAAARLNIFTPADLLERLRQRLDVLGAGGRDLPDRQRTLWGAIGWSYELLDDSERALLELFSVFSTAGLTSLEIVAAQALDARFVLDLLASLVDKSLIRADESGNSQRFSMLLMIKEFAEEHLAASPERDRAVREAHARYFSDFVKELEERLHGVGREEALDELAVEIGNLRTAWRFWVDEGDPVELFGLLDGLWALHEAKGWYHAAIELARDALGVLSNTGPSPGLIDEELTVRTSLARALMAVQGYGPEVEESFQEALVLADRAGSGAQRFPVLRALATYYMGINQWERGAEIGQRLFELAEQEGSDSIRAEAHYVYGAGKTFSGDPETGLAHLEKAIQLHDPKLHGASRFRLGPSTSVVARVASGLVLAQAGELEQAIDRVGTALDVARGIDHPYSLAYAHYHNGYLSLVRGRFDLCLDFAQELAAVAGENEYPVWATLATVLEGAALTGLGKIEEGLELTEAGVDLYQGLSAPPVFWPLILAIRSSVHTRAGRPEIALQLIREAKGLIPEGELANAEFLMIEGDALRMLDDIEGAENAYMEAVRSAQATGEKLAELQSSMRIVALRRHHGRSPDGSIELAVVYERFTEGLDELPLQEARALLASP
jgi:predicted ATPase/class 3 adenylate cyclase